MITGIERLRTAGNILRQDGNGSPSVLLGSASEIWGAMFELPSWPKPLRMKAIDLQSSLFRYGTVRMTVEQMVEPERLQLRRELLEFIELAERLENSSPDGDGAM